MPSPSALPRTLKRPRAALLDMDGTLTEPLLDFPKIKADLGIGNQPILETLATMPPARRTECEAILARHEREAAERSTLNAGCHELLDWFNKNRIGVAVITRNSRACTDIVFTRHGLKIDTLITRDDGLFKPSPAPLLLACEKLDVEPNDAWMIGDGVYDIEAGHNANIHTVWLSHGKTRAFEAEPRTVCRDLVELLEHLKSTE